MAVPFYVPRNQVVIPFSPHPCQHLLPFVFLTYEFFCQEDETLPSPVHAWFCAYVCVLSHVQLFVKPWTVALQAPLSMELLVGNKCIRIKIIA